VLAELAERDATGDAAAIYAEIRRWWGVPYVSSMQRHLATRPGWLGWTWAALRPVFESGRAQTGAWRAVARLEVPRLAPIGADALAVWGVDAGGTAAVRAVCESFVRVSPVNLVFAGLLRRLLRGDRPRGDARRRAAWTPPPALPPPPALVDVAALPPAEARVLLSLGHAVGGEPFVPGLYRMLARWPALLAHLATELAPRLADAATEAACRRVSELIHDEIPSVWADLPTLPERPAMPSPAEFGPVVEALDAYRRTSPEMVVFGRMIGDALPASGAGAR